MGWSHQPARFCLLFSLSANPTLELFLLFRFLRFLSFSLCHLFCLCLSGFSHFHFQFSVYFPLSFCVCSFLYLSLLSLFVPSTSLSLLHTCHLPSSATHTPSGFPPKAAGGSLGLGAALQLAKAGTLQRDCSGWAASQALGRLTAPPGSLAAGPHAPAAWILQSSAYHC